MIDFNFFDAAISYARTFAPNVQTMNFPFDLENPVFCFTTVNIPIDKFEYEPMHGFYVLRKDDTVFVVGKSFMEEVLLKDSDVFSKVSIIWARTKEA